MPNVERRWTPVIPVSLEAKAGESLELVRQRLQGAEIAPLHSSLGDRVKLHVKTKQNKTFFIRKKDTEKLFWGKGPITLSSLLITLHTPAF